MRDPLVISGQDLTVDDIAAVAQGRPVDIHPDAIPRMERSRKAVERLVADGRIAYGITTGFGRFKDKLISGEQVAQLQLNLVRSHASGAGPELDEASVRAMLVVRANTLALGFSGVRPVLVQSLIDLLNHGVYPCIPSRGSLGASGDLAPLAHMALVLIGEGEAIFQGHRLDGASALQQANLKPVVLGAKEGLALTNGTTLMAGIGALLVCRASNLAITADVAASLALEALHGTARAYDARVHAVRPHPRQIACAALLRALLDSSRFLRTADPNNVQDPYTLRCVPQVHGAVRDTIDYARWVVNIELNAANDNPLVFVDEDTGEADIISAGNFHGEPISVAMDSMKFTLTDMGNMSERRTARLVDADCNEGVLPMFLAKNGGLESGLMIAQYTAAALASENKILSHPATADSIPSSANTEDHVSMGAIAVHHTKQVLDHVETIVAIELLTAAQGIDFRCETMGLTPADMGQGTTKAYALIREQVPFLDQDTPLAPHIDLIRIMVHQGRFKACIQSVVDLSKPTLD
jgi:histidine ammonia-lyase